MKPILGHQLTHKLVHGCKLFLHKIGCKVYVLPSFLVGSGVGYCAARFKIDPSILENISSHVGENAADNVTTVEVASPAENQSTVETIQVVAEIHAEPTKK
ncbi:hypothetical protein HA402_004138 [Bradysia odoriphaga]|nr:hypothetical protein HA402_004138 [Bradysia odoriphaga]